MHRTLSVAALLALGTASAARAHVHPVQASGGDDTPAVQSAIDACVAEGHGCVVRLAAGTFHTRQLVAAGLFGAIRGAGRDATVLEALPNLHVSKAESWWDYPPTADAPWPALLTIDDGDVEVSDLTLKITASPAVDGWFRAGNGPYTSSNPALLVTGRNGNSDIRRIAIVGRPDPTGRFGYTIDNCMYFAGFDIITPGGGPRHRLGGTHRVTDSVFTGCSSGTPVTNLDGATIVEHRNTYFGVSTAADFPAYSNTSFDISKNVVKAATIGFIFDFGGSALLPDAPSTVLIAGNRIDLEPGAEAGIVVIDIDPTLDPRRLVSARIVGNYVEAVPGAEAIYVGLTDGTFLAGNSVRGEASDGIVLDGANGCFVAGNDLRDLDASHAGTWLTTATSGCFVAAPSGSVLDEGGGNRIARAPSP